MRIGELSTASGLSRDALRYYERQGLLASVRGGNGYRHYDARAVAWLGYVRQAQALGFTLAEIRRDAALLDGSLPSETAIRHALEAKLAQLDARIAALQDMHASLRARLADPTVCPMQEHQRRTHARGG